MKGLSRMKPKIGIYGLTGCGGDQLTILNCEEKIVEIFAVAKIISFVMAKSDNIEGELDIAFVEGSVSTIRQKKELFEIRENTETLVAIGNCSCYGGPQAMEIDTGKWAKHYKEVYGEVEMVHTKAVESRPVNDFIEVDYLMPGCPIDEYEFMAVFSRLVHGIQPEIYPIPVCAECNWRQNPCLLLEGELCLGPVTRWGCNAVCPSYDLVCVGCQGPVEGANFASELTLLEEKGYDQEDIVTRMRMYGGTHAAIMLKEALSEGDKKDE